MEEAFPSVAPERTPSQWIHETDEELDFVNERLLEDEKEKAAEVAKEEEEASGGVGGFFRSVSRAMITTVQAMRRGVLSEETESMLQDVVELANLFLRDMQLSTMETMGALRVLAGFRSNRAQLTQKPLVDMTVCRTVYYYWQFAEATFGWALTHGMKFERGLSGLAEGLRSSPDALLCQYCKLAPDQIIHTFWESNKHSFPGHFVVRDQRTKSIIWAVRGTFSVRDVITDLVAGSVPFLGGNAHKGMVHCVERLWESVWPIVKEQLSKYPDYGLVFAGHSLGGAVATMLAMKVRAEHPDVDVACWAFGCPPCISLDLAESTRSFVFGVNYGDDVIPRLSFDTVLGLRKRLVAIARAGEAGVWKAWTEGLAASAQAEERLAALGDLSPDFEHWKGEGEAIAKADRLWPPVRQLYLYKVGTDVYAEESSCLDFHSIIISNNSFHDHLPTSYDFALSSFLRRLKENEKSDDSQLSDIIGCEADVIVEAAHHEAPVPAPEQALAADATMIALDQVIKATGLPAEPVHALAAAGVAPPQPAGPLSDVAVALGQALAVGVAATVTPPEAAAAAAAEGASGTEPEESQSIASAAVAATPDK